MKTRPILTAAAMRDAERAEMANGTSEQVLMARAGAALAEAVRLYAHPGPTLVICGPGHNGGDGYVAASRLAAAGFPVRVAALSEPTTETGRWARDQWTGAVEPMGPDLVPATIIVDALFGTGLTRPLDEALAGDLHRLAAAAQIRIACDLPSGVASDDGRILSPVPAFDLTVTFGALKPAHRLRPASGQCGRVVLADIGVTCMSETFEIGRPTLPALDPDGHKYDRGMVHLLAGTMPGAIALAARAAAKSGAGYVRLSTSVPIPELPESIVQTGTAEVNDPRIGAIIVGPGLGDIPMVLTLALTSRAPKIIDADAIGHVGEPERLIGQDAILTPHEGEFVKLFGNLPGSKIERAQAAAKACGNVVVLKGPDTVVAAPDGRVGIAPPAPAWLASAGTGDVLAGMIGALRARGMAAFEAACAGVWLHGRAAEAAGEGMTADTLVEAIPQALGEAE